MSFEVRKLIVTRAKSVIGCALRYYVIVDGRIAGEIANGGTLEIPMNSQQHTLKFEPFVSKLFDMKSAYKGPEPMQIPEGFVDCRANVEPRLNGRIHVELECRQHDRENTLGLIVGFMLLMCARDGSASLYSRMDEFRRAGRELYVEFTMGETGVTVNPVERSRGGMAGGGFKMNYLEMTSSPEYTPIHTADPGEREWLATELENLVLFADGYKHLDVSRSGMTVTISLK